MENQQVSEGAAPAEAAGAWLDKNSESYERVAYLLQLALPSGKPVTDVAVWKIEHPPEALSHFGALAAPRDPDPAVAALRDTCLECWVDAGDLDEANNSLFDVCRRGFAFPRSGLSLIHI